MDTNKNRGVRAVGNRYEARIKDGDRRRSIGFFATAEAARAAYEAAKMEDRQKYPSLNRSELTQRRLKALFHYSPTTGFFTRLGFAGGAMAGTVAGGVNKAHRYRYLRIDGVRYPEHRLAWLYMTGSMPTDQIDHKDGNRANNRFNNLRPATYAQNSQNRPTDADSISGLRGVHWHKPSGKFSARITKDGKHHYLGYFHSPQEAHSAYLEAKRQLHSFQPVPRDFRYRTICGS